MKNFVKSRMLGNNVCRCLHCNYEWGSKLEHPSSCPNCGCRNWDKEPMKLRNGAAIKFFTESLKNAKRHECLLWPYAKAGNGYGSLTENGKKRYTHHLAWIYTFGPIHDNLHVLHHCDTPACYNPYHLFLGTEKDNREDQIRKHRTCFGELNGFAKLTENDVLEIRRLYKKGVRGFGEIALGKKFGTHSINIRKIIRRITWKHI